MSYAWDCFCPVLGCSMVGGMGEDDERMEKEIKSYEGKIIYCDYCRVRFDFTSHRIIEENCDHQKDDIIGG